ncbi:MAG TPA: LytTR family DNA-binding domain-containing protein [Prolixibacteraceae bacterium]|nr:response regulator transcription factor [Bacteroidales bacterium]HPB04781.1 LytTR family DNA-binding domain-containing protein [Prolixibacteraceae bacterium]HQN93960.1 LytTR family DNA-binding domain-containing protein [Prolixibacteraceae bacterium]
MLALIAISDNALRAKVKGQLQSIAEIHQILESSTAEDALFQLLETKPDVLIAFDLLPARNGFHLAGVINDNQLGVPVIVLSDNPLCAIDAIRNHVHDFLVTPYSPEKLIASVRKAFQLRSGKDEGNSTKLRKIKLATAGGFSLFDLDKLNYCMADRTYTTLCFLDGKEECSTSNLGRVEKMLSAFRFARINRSVIVNIDAVRSIDLKRNVCIVDTFSGKKEFKVSKGYLRQVVDIK